MGEGLAEANFRLMAACLFALYVALLPLPVATASRKKFRRSSVTYYLYAPSLGSFPPRPPLVAKFSFTAFATANKALRALVRSKSPIVLRSNLKSNLAKFINLASNFAHRDPHLENVNLKTCGATAPDKTAHSAATSHVQWGRWGFLRRCASSC